MHLWPWLTPHQTLIVQKRRGHWTALSGCHGNTFLLAPDKVKRHKASDRGGFVQGSCSSRLPGTMFFITAENTRQWFMKLRPGSWPWTGGGWGLAWKSELKLIQSESVSGEVSRVSVGEERKGFKQKRPPVSFREQDLTYVSPLSIHHAATANSH